MTRTVLAVAVAALVLLAACAATDGVDPRVAGQQPATTVDSSSPAIELPTTYWPDDPTPGEWYRLDMLDVSQCGYQVLTLPAQTIDDEIFYFNEDATVLNLQTQTFDRSLADANHLPGYGRLTLEGNIDFSGDTVTNIVTYEPTPADVVMERADPCE